MPTYEEEIFSCELDVGDADYHLNIVHQWSGQKPWTIYKILSLKTGTSMTETVFGFLFEKSQHWNATYKLLCRFFPTQRLEGLTLAEVGKIVHKIEFSNLD